MRRVGRTILIAGIVLLGVIQLVPVWSYQTNPAVQAEPAWSSPQTREVVKRACFDCHSNETDWPLYSKVAPVSWLVTYDVVKGRSELNFSTWGSGEQEIGDIAETIAEGEMPPKIYLVTHPQAALTDAERQQLLREFPSDELSISAAPAR
jgi:mono/diheme cytochrome c family protein